VITVAGRPVAALISVHSEHERRTWISKTQLIHRLQDTQADAGLRADLARLAQSTDELGPVR
jgi:antitoxin (DNA-binding transcriptional repressor) of toxin-antitoxin stability system